MYDTYYDPFKYLYCRSDAVVPSTSPDKGSPRNGSMLDTGDQDEIDERAKQRILKDLPTLRYDERVQYSQSSRNMYTAKCKLLYIILNKKSNKSEPHSAVSED